jgi:hypothetical protein
VLFKELNKFPEVERDLALLLDKHITYQEVEKTAFKPKRTTQIRQPLRRLRRQKPRRRQKSYAVRFILSHPDKTLTNDEINQVMDKLIKAYQKELEQACDKSPIQNIEKQITNNLKNRAGPLTGSGFPLQVLARSCVGQHLSVASFNMKFHQPTPNKPRSLWAFRFNPSRTLFANPLHHFNTLFHPFPI